MSSFRLFVAASLLLTMSAAQVVAEGEKADPAFQEQFKKELEQRLPGIGAENISDRAEPQRQIEDLCFQAGAPGREAQRAAACEVIAETLGTQLAKPARIFLLKQLERIGREESIESAAKWLNDGDSEIRGAALSALANIPAPQANAKLLASLPASQGMLRVGLIDALAYRKDTASVDVLATMSRDGDKDVVAAAARALGNIGGSEAAKALKTVLPSSAGDLRDCIADAYLRCAEKLLTEGKDPEAIAIFDELSAPENPRAVRLAALTAKLKAKSKKARATNLDLSQNPNKDSNDLKD